MSLPLFYQEAIALDSALHANLKLRPLGHMTFAADAPVVPLLCSEFAQAAREYPIAFLRNADQSLVSVVLTGIPGGRNVYIDADGQWSALYVPAYARRYPFLLAETAPDQLTVCFDPSCPALNEEEGVALLDDKSEPTAAMKQIVDLLTEYQKQAQLTQSFMQRLNAADLLMEASAQADLQDGRKLDLQGFLMSDEVRFKALPEATLKEWFASGELSLIYAHLLSLSNLLELLRRQPLPEAAPTDALQPEVAAAEPLPPEAAAPAETLPPVSAPAKPLSGNPRAKS